MKNFILVSKTLKHFCCSVKIVSIAVLTFINNYEVTRIALVGATLGLTVTYIYIRITDLNVLRISDNSLFNQ